MKPFFTVFCMAAILGIASETKAQLSIGGGVGYGTDVEEIGLQVRAIYGLTDNIRVGGDFLYYLVSGDGLSLYETNLNGHYAFANTDKFIGYGLVGLNLLTARVSIFGISGSTSEVGLNVGAGGQVKFTDKISGLLEAKYAIGDAGQAVIGLGLLFSLGN
jgi:opacity protein-like surface antigen